MNFRANHIIFIINPIFRTMDEFRSFLNELDNLKCHKHEEEDILMVCTEKNCKKCFLCIECVTEHDSTHKSKIQSIDDYRDNFVRIKLELARFITPKKPDLPESFYKKPESFNYSKNGKEKIEEIEKDFDQLKVSLVEKIDQIKNHLLLQWHYHYQQHLQVL